jgi:non-specific serine/threonine protein kinase
MPLAIELAAARLRSFTPQQIADYLDRRFRILTGGARTALPRQQTLAATIDWSYRLLDDRERLLFERLSMFQGGFDLEAAQQVCSGDGLDEFDVFELVPTLVDKSLVNADVGGDHARYRLLETIRQFARDKLDEAGFTDAVRKRHAEYFMQLAEEAEGQVRGPQEKEWWDRLNTELDNLRLAMEWSIEANEPELGMRLTSAIWRFWWFTFRFSEGATWLKRMYEARGSVGGVTLAKTMLGLGTLCGFVNELDISRQMLEGAIDLYRELDAAGTDPVLLRYGYSAALINLSATFAEPSQDYDLARELNEEALEVARRLGDRAGEAVALGNLAEAAGDTGDYETARRGYAEGIAASKALHSAQRTVEAILQAAAFESSLLEPARSSQLLEEAILISEEGNLPIYRHFAGAMRAVEGQVLGEEDAKRRFVGHVGMLYADPEFTSVYWPLIWTVVGRAIIELQTGDLERAARLLGIIDRLEAESSPLDRRMQRRLDKVREPLLSSMGAERLEELRAAGKALPLESAIQLIVAD